ncbi:MAG: hypothetical protein H0V82_13395 [Candidatus Protochlamydia sp.]|nr:hypothetical protein [Candidatus Protochlamydia sp.]
MSFKVGRFFYLAISFILGAFFFIVGLFSIGLPWSPHLQHGTIKFLTENTLILSLFGLGFTLIGLSIFIYAALNTKRRYAFIKIGPYSISLDESLIQSSLDAYWKEHFPEHSIPFNLFVRKNSIQIEANFPSMPEAEQHGLLKKINHDFGALFGQILGYPHEVRLIASFESNKA